MPPTTVRKGGTALTIRNSGNEVWLYDDANREAIRTPGEGDDGHGGLPPRFQESTAQGLIVGYSLYQDGAVQVTVIVGEPLTEKELSAVRWLEPQTAFLKLPSGRLCVESNDASRIGPEEPAEEGAVVAARGLRVGFIDMNDRICPTAWCPVMRDGIVIFTDDNHLTATFSRSMAPVFGERMELAAERASERQWQ